jgi:nicotinate phosphoribosyltransferase
MPVTPLATDLYQLTMMAGYFHTGRHAVRATFELFTRRLPPHRNCLVFAGLDQALAYLEELRFSAEEVAWLAALPAFSGVAPAFFDYLRGFRFTGDVWAMPEGTPFLPNEPILRITAPLAQAQLVETALLAILSLQTSIASKALRIVGAAGDRPVMEFGARRAHGTEAALYAARAAYVAGCTATSFVEAGRRFGIPLTGTMAHSWVLASESEIQAFREYAEVFGAKTTLLLDTYDVASAAAAVVESGLEPPAVRIDSGDLLSLARHLRQVFDAGGLAATRIIVSGDLDEWKIRDLIAAGAPIDGYAVGTALTTSEDAPALGAVYKLVEIEAGEAMRPVMKRSAGKSTRPGAKQVWRVFSDDVAAGDVVSLVHEPGPRNSIALLHPVMRQGSRIAAAPALSELRARCAESVAVLPRSLRALEPGAEYAVNTSAGLQAYVAAGTAPDLHESRRPGERPA